MDLSRISFGDTTLLHVLDLVLRHARDQVPHADALSITLATDDRYYTPVDTDERVRKADHLQYSLKEGPCVDTVDQGQGHEILDMGSETRYTRYAPAARELGIGSSVAVPLMADSRSVGALNVYSWRAGAFDENDRKLASEFAEEAGVVIANAVAIHEKDLLVDQLRQAVETRETIGKAIGILMEREGVSDEDAFAMLRTASQNSNVKLRDIAAEVVERALRATQPRDE